MVNERSSNRYSILVNCILANSKRYSLGMPYSGPIIMLRINSNRDNPQANYAGTISLRLITRPINLKPNYGTTVVN